MVGQAPNGKLALEKVAALSPDAVTMDIEMPEMNGIEAVRALRRTHPRLPVVMFSTLTERGAAATLDALSAGASDYVTKPSNVGSFADSQRNVREQLIPKLKALTSARRRVPAVVPWHRARSPAVVPAPGLSASSPSAAPPAAPTRSPPCSRRSPPTSPCPSSSSSTCRRCSPGCSRTGSTASAGSRSLEAKHGDALVPGRVLVAPGGFHLVVRRHGTAVVAELNEDPPENFCRPAVDVLFRSVKAVYGDRVLATVLTGMGRDGERGSKVIRDAGGEIYVQDDATSVVWGMPGAVAGAGLADKILPLPQIGPALANALSRSASAAAVTT